MTEDQFIEHVTDAMDRHISRDPTVVPEDQEWETRNFARTLAQSLRVNGFNVPRVSRQ